MAVRVRSTGGNLIANNSTSIVSLLAAPPEGRGLKLLSMLATGSDAQNSNDRCILGLNLGKLRTGEMAQATQTVSLTDPFFRKVTGGGSFLNLFAHAAVTGGTASGGPVQTTVVVPLHGLVVAEQVDLLVYLPDNTGDLNWCASVFYEEVKLSRAEWQSIRHRPPVEFDPVGFLTV